jgi:cytochrome c556
VAQKQPEADRLMQLLQSATNPADPQVVAAQQRMESLGVELQALQAIAQGATPQMATQNLPVLSQQLQASEAGIMQAQQRGVQEDDAQFQQMVGQHMQMLQQNIGLTSLLLYAARQGVLPVDTSGPDPGMAKLPNPQAAAAELQQKQPEYEQLFSELNGAQGQPPPDKVAKFQQLGFELGALDALSAGVTPRQAVAQLKPTRDALEANVAELNRLNPDGSKTNDAAVQQKITEQVELHGRIEALESLILYAARNGALAL